MIGDPPSAAGAAQITTAEPSEAVAVTPVGASGTVRGRASSDGSDSAEGPATLKATTLNAYVAPFSRSPTVQEVSPVVVHVMPPGLAIAAYPVIGAPPSDTGGVQVTSAEALPAAALTPVGAPGTVRGVTSSDGSDCAEVPATLPATTVNE
ncbi:MAG: hypothetical protein WCF12_07760 [Propionicimonas sp.]